MPQETIYIYWDKEYAQIGAAMYIATVCYPNNIQKRDCFVNACKAHICLKITAGKYKTRWFSNKGIASLAKDKRKIDSQFRKTGKILEKRIKAWGIFKLKLMNLAAPVTYNGKKFSVQQVLNRLFPTDTEISADEHNKDNAFHRLWTPSKPVMHLVAGLNDSLRQSAISFCFDSLIDDPFWVCDALNKGENLRKIIASLPQLKIHDNQQIQLLPRDFS
jgi:hypothetical protein